MQVVWAICVSLQPLIFGADDLGLFVNAFPMTAGIGRFFRRRDVALVLAGGVPLTQTVVAYTALYFVWWYEFPRVYASLMNI